MGTSGWQYTEWRGVLYPAGVAQSRWLEHYAAHFVTVENNGSFYRLPSEQTFAQWRTRTPEGFVMAVKASRYLTHVRRLRDPAEPVERLMRAAAGLGSRLGPVLLQLPPNFRADPAALEALDACLREFSRFSPQPGARGAAGRGVRVAVELRHESWWTEPTRELLTRHNATLCWADRRGRPLNPLWRTADWGYIRFHEGGARPWPRYGQRALSTWVQRTAGTWPDEDDIFVYFNNDQGGAAVHDAVAFAAIARRSGRTVPLVTGLPEAGLGPHC